MKVVDFLNEAWLQGKFDGRDRAVLCDLQKFATNQNAEVIACNRGLLVFDITGEKIHYPTEPSLRYTTNYGTLFLIDGSRPKRVVSLTGREEFSKLQELALKFISEEKYCFGVDGVDKFKEDYNAGIFKKGSEPGEE